MLSCYQHSLLNVNKLWISFILHIYGFSFGTGNLYCITETALQKSKTRGLYGEQSNV